jgi:hypothetical protein
MGGGKVRSPLLVRTMMDPASSAPTTPATTYVARSVPRTWCLTGALVRVEPECSLLASSACISHRFPSTLSTTTAVSGNGLKRVTLPSTCSRGGGIWAPNFPVEGSACSSQRLRSAPRTELHPHPRAQMSLGSSPSFRPSMMVDKGYLLLLGVGEGGVTWPADAGVGRHHDRRV